MMIKKCVVCGKEFHSKGKHNIYCSTQCNDIEKKRREKEKYGRRKEYLTSGYKKPESGRKKEKRSKGSSIGEINRLARACHMTYGQYVARMEVRKERVLRRKDREIVFGGNLSGKNE